MGIKQEVDGTWTVSFHKRHPKTRIPISRKKIHIKTRAEAHRIFSQLVLDVEMRIRREVVPTWGDWYQSFMLTSKEAGLTPKTLHNYETSVGAYTLESWRETPIDEINTGMVRETLDAKLSGRSSSQQSYIYRVVRMVFQNAVDAGKLSKNPVPVLRKKDRASKMRGVLSESEARKLLLTAQQLNWPWYPHYAMALYTGMRNGELYALTWDKVDLENRRILVNFSWSNINGLKSTKSGEDRLVEIATALVPLLQELKIARANGEYVLGHRERWSRNRQAHDLRLFCEGQGLPRIKFHDQRAVWATMLLGRGVEPVKLMAMGGWKDMKTMMIYIRKAGLDIKGVTDTLSLHTHGQKSANVIEIGQL